MNLPITVLDALVILLILASAGVVRLVQIVRRWVYAFGVKRRSAPHPGEAHRAPEPKSA